MMTRRFERRVEIPEEELIGSDRPASSTECDPRASVAKKKPSHGSHTGGGEPGEHGLELRAFFLQGNSAGGMDLMKTDGTMAGTQRVTQIFTAQELLDRTENLHISMTNVRGTLYLTASNGTSGVELFKSDGTAAG